VEVDGSGKDGSVGGNGDGSGDGKGSEGGKKIEQVRSLMEEVLVARTATRMGANMG
jgi:hypothetical protein